MFTALVLWLLRKWYGDDAHPACLGRAPGWDALRRDWLDANPCCAVCGSREGCVPHHKLPVHAYPERELDWDNLITLCPEHHLLFGHLMLWQAWNLTVEADCVEWRGKILHRSRKEE